MPTPSKKQIHLKKWALPAFFAFIFIVGACSNNDNSDGSTLLDELREADSQKITVNSDVLEDADDQDQVQEQREPVIILHLSTRCDQIPSGTSLTDSLPIFTDSLIECEGEWEAKEQLVGVYVQCVLNFGGAEEEITTEKLYLVPNEDESSEDESSEDESSEDEINVDDSSNEGDSNEEEINVGVTVVGEIYSWETTARANTRIQSDACIVYR